MKNHRRRPTSSDLSPDAARAKEKDAYLDGEVEERGKVVAFLLARATENSAADSEPAAHRALIVRTLQDAALAIERGEHDA